MFSFNSTAERGIKKHGEEGEEGSVWPQRRARHWIHGTQHRDTEGDLREEEAFEGTSLTPFKLSVSNRACFSS